jgi:hypothetical protein
MKIVIENKNFGSGIEETFEVTLQNGKVIPAAP